MKQAKAALYNRSDDWRASKQWVEEQRKGTAGSQATEKAAATRTFPSGTPWAPSSGSDQKTAEPPPGMHGLVPGEAIGFYSGCEMLPVFEQELNSLSSTFRGYYYVVDHTTLCFKLALKANRGVQCRMILDRPNFTDSSCARQAHRLKELLESGVEMRVVKPAGGGFASMHVKTLIIDDKTVLTGSVNMTHNGLENNKEHLFRISVASVVAEVTADFDQLWTEAEPVTMDLMDQVVAKSDAKAEKKKGGRTKSVSRSLSKEISDVASDRVVGDG